LPNAGKVINPEFFTAIHTKIKKKTKATRYSSPVFNSAFIVEPG
jgi:hypothetical protein